MPDPTQPPTCSGCPLYGVAKGFVLGAGDPKRARYAVVLEAPGRDEVTFELKPNPARAFLQTKEECEKEIALRRRDYPDMDESFLRRGVPVVGQTGLALQFWIFPKAGIKREECYIDNTIRCLPPRSKSGAQYPTGEIRKHAELHCRQYDRLGDFAPDTGVVSLHPASLLREITPLPLEVKDFEKVRDFTAQSRKVLALLGGKAAKAFLGYAENSTRWRGHYVTLDKEWYNNVVDRLKNGHKNKKAPKRSKDEAKEEDFFCVPHTTTLKARAKEAAKAQALLEKCRKDQSSSEIISIDSSSDSVPKKTRRRKKSKLEKETSLASEKAKPSINDQMLCEHSSVQSTDKAGGV